MTQHDDGARERGVGEDFVARAEASTQGLVGDLILFLRTNKKWWLTPIVIVLLLVAVLSVLGSSAAAPFIYTLF